MAITINEIIEAFDIRSAQEKYYENRKKRYASYTNRASSIGYFVPSLDGCQRKGVYERLNWRDKQLFDTQSYIRFEEGNRQEEHVLSDLKKWGFDIIKQQDDFIWEKYQISGHIDGKWKYKDIEPPVEIKSMSPFIFQKVGVYEDLNKESWLRAYKAQINIYMLYHNIDFGIFVCKDKSSGAIKPIVVEMDYQLAEDCLQTAEIINEHVKNKTYPDQIDDHKVCEKCLYNHICMPDVEFGVPLKISEDKTAVENIDYYLANKFKKKEIEQLWNDIIKPAIKAEADEEGRVNLVLGKKYHITGKNDARGSFRAKIDLIGTEE